MPRGELWEILRSYQPFNSCRTTDRVNGIRERERIFPQTPESWQFGNCGGPPAIECHVLHLESDREGQ